MTAPGRLFRIVGCPGAGNALALVTYMAHPTRRGHMECAICKVEFVPKRRDRPNQKTCGRRCANTLIARTTIEARADAMRDKGEGKGYRKRRGRHEHRSVAEQMVGRPLLDGEIVHHLNGDKRDNRPENLQVLPSQAEHARLHFTKNRTCEIQGCEKKHRAHGLCGMHYQRAMKHLRGVMPT